MTFWFLNGPVRHLLCSPESRAALKLRMCSTLQNTRSLCSAYITSTGLRNAMIICALGLKALTSWAAFLEPRYAVEASFFSHFEQRQNSSDNPPEFEQFFDRKKYRPRKIGVL